MEKGDYPLVLLSKRSNKYFSGVGEEYQVHHQYLSRGRRIVNQESLYTYLVFSFKIKLQGFVEVIIKEKEQYCFVKFPVVLPPLAPN